jgi:hypothetical protein
MSTVGLFLMGVVVSLITIAALGLLVYAAILDGRYDREQSAAQPADVVVIPSKSREPDLGHAA